MAAPKIDLTSAIDIPNVPDTLLESLAELLKSHGIDLPMSDMDKAIYNSIYKSAYSAGEVAMYAKIFDLHA